ncbi:ExbD/TolR family protein [Portibacter marinus]|uniref:ExbD/TolR family protein n=1 Tax=Portibacter marinus TaxID=2898660 RepID=UPI001F41BD90|nr:biopolymer transporter ExbD [Portibacter marinus]
MRRRNKVSAEFNMSSLTDIIFLLLIFFMLTSAAIQINIELPESDSRTVAPTDIPVMLTTDGVIKFKGKVTQKSKLRGLISEAKSSSENSENATVTIISQTGVPWKDVADIMEISNSLGMRAIISTQPRK